jgi:hypothetical protein
VKINKQFRQGNYVIHDETVVRRGKTFQVLSVYEVEGGLIKSVLVVFRIHSGFQFPALPAMCKRAPWSVSP